MDYNGRHFRCLVTDQGVTIQTNGALLTVVAAPPLTATTDAPLPKTGDAMPIGLLLLAFGASGSCLIINGKKERRRSSHA